MNIGESIRRRREEKGITQAQLAQSVYITQSMLCQIERGTKSLSVPLGMEIASVLGCRIEDFTGNGDETERIKKNEAS